MQIHQQLHRPHRSPYMVARRDTSNQTDFVQLARTQLCLRGKCLMMCWSRSLLTRPQYVCSLENCHQGGNKPELRNSNWVSNTTVKDITNDHIMQLSYICSWLYATTSLFSGGIHFSSHVNQSFRRGSDIWQWVRSFTRNYSKTLLLSLT